MTYRISIGIDPKIWTQLTIQRMSDTLLTVAEAKSLTHVRGTLILYTEDPDRVLLDLLQDGYTLTDFRWLNVSKEN